MISLIERETYPEDSNNDTVFPLTLTSCVGGDSVIHYEKYAWDAALALLKTSPDIRFSNDTALLLKSIVKKKLRDSIYSINSEIVRGYTFPESGEIPEIYGESRPVSRDDNFENLIDYDIDPLCEGWRCFATIIDGKICSIACENPHFNDGYADIGVFTAPEYRGRGYAAANAAALVKLLTDEGNIVTYSCSADNYAAIKTAEKIGFRHTHNAMYIYGEPFEE